MYHDASPLFAGNSLYSSLACCVFDEELGPCAATGFLRLPRASEIQSQDLAFNSYLACFKTSTECIIYTVLCVLNGLLFWEDS